MAYFFYCRDNRGSAGLRRHLVEAHWSFMDGYAGRMIARGPTLAEDGDTATGSLHIVDLSSAEEARVFAFEEPNYRAGVYADVMVRRWENVLARKMWSFGGTSAESSRFLVIAHGKADAGAAADVLGEAHRAFLRELDRRGQVILGGPLRSEDGAKWSGSALMIEAPSAAAVPALLAADPYGQAGLYEDIEIHRWRFGGRPDGVFVQ
ncbi:YciI family protein [Labrys neptuniae]